MREKLWKRAAALAMASTVDLVTGVVTGTAAWISVVAGGATRTPAWLSVVAEMGQLVTILQSS